MKTWCDVTADQTQPPGDFIVFCFQNILKKKKVLEKKKMISLLKENKLMIEDVKKIIYFQQ